MADDRAFRGVDLLLRVLGRAGSVDVSNIAQTRSADNGESTPVVPGKVERLHLTELQGRDQPSAGHRYHHGVQKQLDRGVSRGAAHRPHRRPGRLRLRAHALPRSKLLVLAIFTFIFYWNDFTWPYITISKADMMTMPIALIQFRQDFAITYGKQMAGNVLSALPAIIVFLVAQRMIIRSITLTGIKG
jgi:hypothetical protein